MDHRVEPPSWLPEEVTPDETGPASPDSTVPAPEAPDKPTPSNGQDGITARDYGYDGSYVDNEGSTLGGAEEDSSYGGNETVSDSAHDSSRTRAYPVGVPAAGYPAGFGADPAGFGADPGPAGEGGSAVAAGAAPGQAGSPYSTYGTVNEPKPAPSQPRRANLVIARLEPWSVMKFSFLMSLVAWIVLFVAVAILYYALSGLGVFAALQRTLSSVTSSQNSAGVNLSQWTSPSRVLGYTMLIGAVNVVLITALSTVGAMIYNLVTHLGGGVEVTLRETD